MKVYTTYSCGHVTVEENTLDGEDRHYMFSSLCYTCAAHSPSPANAPADASRPSSSSGAGRAAHSPSPIERRKKAFAEVDVPDSFRKFAMRQKAAWWKKSCVARWYSWADTALPAARVEVWSNMTTDGNESPYREAVIRLRGLEAMCKNPQLQIEANYSRSPWPRVK